MEQALAPLITGLITGIVTAVISVRLALNRFRTEKWWERKADAYVNIVESLHHIKKPLDLIIENYQKEMSWGDEAINNEDIDEEAFDQEIEKLYDSRMKYMAEIRKQEDIGSLVISLDAVKALENFEEELFEHGGETCHSFATGPQAEQTIIENCLEKIREIARKDLHVS